jgi:exopolysaccharide biosynthesis polyprenyl glycosylphosphotransferase
LFVEMRGLLPVNKRYGGRIVPREKVLLVGAGPAAQVAARKLPLRPGGVSLVGLLSDDPESDPRGGPPLTHLGTPNDFERVCGSHRVDRVVLAAPTLDGAQLGELIRQAADADVKVSVLPWVIDPNGALGETDRVAVIGVEAEPPRRLPWLIKRTLDVVVAALALVTLLPLLLLVALAIKLDSPGPVLFRQERVGRYGRRFRFYKLRTMVRDAEARIDELRASSAHPAWLLLEKDPRVTRVGRFLRQTSIDELPQLFNVLLGQMSLVGPRPLPPYEDVHVTGWGRRRLDFPPGITGLWQVLGRVSISFEEMIKLDYLYVSNWTLRGDLVLLLRTVRAVLTRRGAN